MCVCVRACVCACMCACLCVWFLPSILSPYIMFFAKCSEFWCVFRICTLKMMVIIIITINCYRAWKCSELEDAAMIFKWLEFARGWARLTQMSQGACSSGHSRAMCWHNLGVASLWAGRSLYHNSCKAQCFLWLNVTITNTDRPQGHWELNWHPETSQRMWDDKTPHCGWERLWVSSKGGSAAVSAAMMWVSSSFSSDDVGNPMSCMQQRLTPAVLRLLGKDWERHTLIHSTSQTE